MLANGFFGRGRPSPFTAADFLASKRSRRRGPTAAAQAAAAKAFFAPLLAAGLAKEVPLDQDAGKVGK